MVFDGATSGDYQAAEVLPAGKPGFYRAKLELEADEGGFDPAPPTQIAVFFFGHDQLGQPEPPDPTAQGLWTPATGAGSAYDASLQLNRKLIVDLDLTDGQALYVYSLVQNPVVEATIYVKVTLVKLGE